MDQQTVRDRYRRKNALDSDPCSLSNQDEVLEGDHQRRCDMSDQGPATHRQTMHNGDPLTLLDDVGEHAQSRRHALVVTGSPGGGVDVHGVVGTSLPVNMRRMDRVLHLHFLSA